MPLDYSSGNKSNIGLMALFPRRSYAKEQAIEDRKIAFMALQANQAMQEQATTARAVAEYDSRISAIQQVPFLGADKNNISKWLDEYQKKVKEKIKAEYGDNPKEYIQSEGAFMASKIQNDFLSSGTYKQGEKNRIQAGLAMEALQKGETPIGYFDEGKYVAGTQEINDYMTGKSASITYRGSYKADPNKMIEYFSKMPRPLTESDFIKNEKGEVTGLDFSKTNPHLGANVPEKDVERYMLGELGSREALEDFKQKNPGLISNVKYSDNLDKAMGYAKEVAQQEKSQAELEMSKGRYGMAATINEKDKLLKDLSIVEKSLSIEKKKNELSGDNADVNSNQGIFETIDGPQLTINGIDKPFSGRDATVGRTAQTIADDRVIKFKSMHKVDVKDLKGSFYTVTPGGTIDGKKSRDIIRLSDENANIVVPGSGDIGISQKDYSIVNFDDTNGLLIDKSNNYWTKGTIFIKKEAYDKIPEAKRKLGQYKDITTTEKGMFSDSKKVIGYEATFYAPIKLKPKAVKQILDASIPSKFKAEASQEESIPVGNYTDDYYNI